VTKKLLSCVLASAVLGVVSATPVLAADIQLKSDAEKFSYTIGFQIGQSLKRDGLSVDPKIVSQAIADVLGGKDPILSMDEMQKTVQSYQQKMMAEREAKGEGAKKAGEAFLADNKSKEGVKTLPSGVQYKVVMEGKGKKPTAKDSVVAHYRGTLIDGTEFDSSYTRGEPATFPVTGVIPGWQEILPMMPVGSKWQVFIPSELAYGTRGAGNNIGPNETLVFDIELLEIKAQ